MKKKVVSCMLVASMLLSMTACGNDSKATGGESAGEGTQVAEGAKVLQASLNRLR